MRRSIRTGTAMASSACGIGSGRAVSVRRCARPITPARRRSSTSRARSRAWSTGTPGRIRSVELFVAVLGASSCTYAKATATHQLPDWVGAHLRMVECFAGVTALWVPDQGGAALSRLLSVSPTKRPVRLQCARLRLQRESGPGCEHLLQRRGVAGRQTRAAWGRVVGRDRPRESRCVIRPGPAGRDRRTIARTRDRSPRRSHVDFERGGRQCLRHGTRCSLLVDRTIDLYSSHAIRLEGSA